MNIPPNDFRWYAAFHDEGDHPHVHMMAWSAGDALGYLSKVGIQNIKSALTNDIFCQEMLHAYEQKSQSRDELVAEARRTMLELADQMKHLPGQRLAQRRHPWSAYRPQTAEEDAAKADRHGPQAG